MQRNENARRLLYRQLPDRMADWAHTRPNESAYNLQSVLFYLIDITNDDSFNLSATVRFFFLLPFAFVCFAVIFLLIALISCCIFFVPMLKIFLPFFCVCVCRQLLFPLRSVSRRSSTPRAPINSKCRSAHVSPCTMFLSLSSCETREIIKLFCNKLVHQSHLRTIVFGVGWSDFFFSSGFFFRIILLLVFSVSLLFLVADKRTIQITFYMA